MPEVRRLWPVSEERSMSVSRRSPARDGFSVGSPFTSPRCGTHFSSSVMFFGASDVN